MDKISGIYKITNIVNNKVYIGQSVNIYARWRDHKCRLRNGKCKNIYLQRAWDKYGEQNFVFDIVLICSNSKDVLDENEIKYISIYNSNNRNYGYNIDNGGNGINKISEETKQKLSVTIKNKYKNDPIYKEKTLKAKKLLYVPIYQIDFNGNIVNEWKSITEASNCGYDNVKIGLCINNKALSHKGYIWIKKMNYNKDTFDINNYKWESGYKNLVPIYQYNLDGTLCNLYDSYKTVPNEFIPGQLKTMSLICIYKDVHKNYLWSYDNLSKDEVINLVNSR